jgi:hypothetical protein
MTTEHKYATSRGAFYIKTKGTSENFQEMGNSADAEVAMSVEFATLESSGDERGTLAKEETKRSATLKITSNSQATAMFKKYVYSKATTSQAADTDVAFTLPAMAPGELFKFADNNVSNVTITGKTAGVDYVVKPKSGAIVAKTAFTAGVEGTYDCGAATNIGVFTDSDTEYEVLFVSETSGRTIHFRRWKPSPAATMKLIDSSNIASFNLEGELMIDESIPEGVLGRYAVVTEADEA